MSADKASAIPSRLKPSRASSLRYASSVMAILPVALGCLLALGTLLLGPSAEAVAGVAAILFGINALIMPRLLDWRIGARLTALVDTLRAARDGQFERVPHMNDNDAIGDIARLAHDLVAMQAHSGRFALGLHRAKEFAQTSDDMIDRLSEGAHEVERMLAVFEGSTKTLSRVSERFVGNLNAVTTGADRNVQYLVDAASRAIRSAETLTSAAGKASGIVGHPATVEMLGGRTLAQAIDPVLGKLEDLSQAIAGLPKAAEMRRICAGAGVPVLEKLSELSGQTKASLAALEAPIVEARRTLEAKLDTMDGRIATSRRDADAAAVKTLSEMTILSDAVARVEARLSGIAARVAPVATPTIDMSPLMERLALLERPLAVLLERPAAYVEPVDIEPVKAALVDIAARLATIGADAAKAAQIIPSVDIAPVIASLARLEQPLARLTERAPSEPVNLEPAMAGLADLASKFATIEAYAAHAARAPAIAAPALDIGPVIEGIARLEPPLALLIERSLASPEAIDLGPVMAGLAEIVARLTAVEAHTVSAPAESHPDARRVAEFDAARAPMQRILAGLPLALREISEDAARFRDAVRQIGSQIAPDTMSATAPPMDLSPIAEQLDDIVNRLSSLAVATQEAVRSRSAVPDPSLRPDAAANAPMQKILNELRLTVREIAEGAAEIRETVKRIGSHPVAEPLAAAVPSVDLPPVDEQLDEPAQRFSSIEGAMQEPGKAWPATAPAANAIESQILPRLVDDRNAISTALTGLKLMMREIATEATALRAAADSPPAKSEIAAPAAASIADPFAALREELAAGHGVLAEIHAQIGRDRLLAEQLPGNAPDTGTPSLTTILSLMSAFSSAVEIRFTDIEESIADAAQIYQSDVGLGAGDELATRLREAASNMRTEFDQFLAVGAAVSGEIEAAARHQMLPRKAQQSRSAMRLA